MTKKRARYPGEREADCKPSFSESKVLVATIGLLLSRSSPAEPRVLMLYRKLFL